MSLAENIHAKLTKAFDPINIELVDESHQHIGHSGSGGGAHFALKIISESFQDKLQLERHRMVYEVLSEEMGGAVHALSIKALTPSET